MLLSVKSCHLHHKFNMTLAPTCTLQSLNYFVIHFVEKEKVLTILFWTYKMKSLSRNCILGQRKDEVFNSYMGHLV